MRWLQPPVPFEDARVVAVLVTGLDAFVVFDRPVTFAAGLSVLLTVGAVTITWTPTGGPVGANVVTVSGPIAPGDPWTCLQGEDPLLSVPPGGGGFLGAASGVVLELA